MSSSVMEFRDLYEKMQEVADFDSLFLSISDEEIVRRFELLVKDARSAFIVARMLLPNAGIYGSQTGKVQQELIRVFKERFSDKDIYAAVVDQYKADRSVDKYRYYHTVDNMKRAGLLSPQVLSWVADLIVKRRKGQQKTMQGEKVRQVYAGFVKILKEYEAISAERTSIVQKYRTKKKEYEYWVAKVRYYINRVSIDVVNDYRKKHASVNIYSDEYAEGLLQYAIEQSQAMTRDNEQTR